MKKFATAAVITGAIFLVSCYASPTEQQTDVPLPALTPATQAQVADSSANPINSNTPVAASTPQGATTVTVNAGNKIPASSAAALNPEHGRPGHRCDIPVGTPLSTPVQPMQQQAQPQPSASNPGVIVQPQPSQVLPAQPAPAANGIGRINPAHGQPGHDCSIPVGQPLKS